MMKQVTIAICNYNYENRLAAAIDSALGPDYPPITVPVVGGGSTDGSRASFDAACGAALVGPVAHDYLHTINANLFGSLKKLGTLVLSNLCLVPYSPLSDFAVRCIANPLARRGVAGRRGEGGRRG